MVLLGRDRCILMLNQNHRCFSYFSPVLAPRPCLNIPMHYSVCHTTGNISSGCLLFLSLSWSRETVRKTEPNKTEQAKRKAQQMGVWKDKTKMLSDHILSSLLQYFGTSGQPFLLLGEGSMRRPWLRNVAWAACCALGRSTSPGLEAVLGLLRTGKQFLDNEHQFSSWGETKCEVSPLNYTQSLQSHTAL